MAYWFNVDTHQVESDDDKSQGAQLMGPYDSQEAAASALESARKNTEDWDAEDKAWNEGTTEA
ncbi:MULTISPECIES: hypothetical protein [unclassified Phycicoccus]|uniref:hypothetical protein n=1 Tax=unclassified Phycicoccus TaxID=2637926 RepID=UPI00070269E5|nr:MULTISPECIES: hypothetical protein [unclassified Phycicoccus]KQU66272.1 methionine aminopeptidase [Phycicoccus sp. Root101]KQZ87402.1 methionine aminopeptidase [Phycicoccus sp. Root563]